MTPRRSPIAWCGWCRTARSSSVTGKVIKMRTDTVCIHGDTPGAVEIGRGVRPALKAAGITVAPFKTKI